MVRQSGSWYKGCEFDSLAGRNCRWGEMYSALSTLNTTIEVLLSKAPNPQLLPGSCSINGCPLLWVCVHSVCVCVCVCSLLWVCTLDGLNAEHEFRVWVTILATHHFRFHCSVHTQISNLLEWKVHYSFLFNSRKVQVVTIKFRVTIPDTGMFLCCNHK